MSKILIAEDERQLRMGIALSLKTGGHDVHEAENGAEALGAILRATSTDEPFDLLVCDIQMPRMTGEQLLARLMELRLRLPTLVITGYGEKKLLVRLMRLGCNDFIDKPFDPEMLCKQVTAIIDAGSASSAESGRAGRLFEFGERTRQTAHDLTAVLDGIKGNAAMALREIGPGHLTRLYIEKVLSASGRAAEICRNLLDCSRPAGESMLVMAEMNSVVAKIGTLLQDVAPEAVKVTATTLDHPVWLRADAERMQQALLYCGFHAFGAMPQGGEFSIRLTETQSARPAPAMKNVDCVAITMKISGIVIPAANAKQPVESGISVLSAGSGFMQGNITEIVEKEHGGWMAMNSEEGETVFTFTFPAR